MFVSKKRSIVIPQHEHLTMVGTIGYFFGNDKFSIPEIPFDSFLKACRLHDAGYGYMDTAVVGAVSEEIKLSAWDACIHQELDDPCASLIICHHFQRLSHYGQQTEGMQSFQKTVQQSIEDLLHQQSYAADIYKQVDEVINVCDALSFFYCFESSMEGDLPLQGSTLHYSINPDTHVITLSHWPFRASYIEGMMLGYQKERYPQTLHPVVIPYTIRP